MEVNIFVGLAAFIAAMLTFFSGFGLGTLLTPVFMLFFPAEVAVAFTAVVHFFNNVCKIFLVGKYADRQVVLRFGIPAILMAMAGAWILTQISDYPPLFSYMIGDRRIDIYPVKLLISVLLLVFALMDILPFFAGLQFGKNSLPVGGAISGFFGGLSGHQGALRSAFLVRLGLSKEAFIGSTTVVSTMVDIIRLLMYSTLLHFAEFSTNSGLIITTTAAAVAGALAGNFFLKKVTIESIKYTVAVMLILLALALASGLI
jgi:uncharacterized membrane protein YfcA